MADREKVIKGLTCCRNGFCFACPYNDGVDGNVDCKQKWADDALELLKAQEAVVPVLAHEGANKQRNDYKCPECQTLLYYEQRYCEQCGRKVKWND